MRVPDGYHKESRTKHPEEPYFAAIGLASLYGAHVAIALESKDVPGATWLYVPVIGTVGFLIACDGKVCSDARGTLPWVLFDVVAQVALIGTILHGIYTEETIFVRNVPKARPVAWSLRPGWSTRGTYLDLQVRF